MLGNLTRGLQQGQLNSVPLNSLQQMGQAQQMYMPGMEQGGLSAGLAGMQQGQQHNGLQQLLQMYGMK